MMAQRITRLTVRTVFVALVILLGLSLAAPPAEAQGLQVFTIDRDADQLHRIDPVTGATLSSVTITLTGETVQGGVGLAVDPTNGTMYALLKLLSSTGPRRLVTINPADGVATNIGDADDTTGIVMVDITLGADGTLFGVSSSANGTAQDTIFTINKTTGVPTATAAAITAGNFGHAIGFANSKIFHYTGEGVQNTDEIFETVDPANSFAVANVPLSVDDLDREITGLVFWGNNLFLAVSRNNAVGVSDVSVISTTGAVRFMGSLDHVAAAVAITGTAPVCTAAGNICGVAHIGDNTPAVLFSVSQATGAASMVGPIGFERVSGMAFRADGVLFASGERMDGTDTDVLLTVDPATGAGTEVGPTNLAGIGSRNITDISFRHGDGTLFGVAETNDVIITIDTGTGAATLVGAHGACGFGQGLAFDFDDTLFHADGDGCNLNTIDQSTGAATSVAALTFSPPLDTGNARVNGMDFQPVTGALFGSVPTIFGGAPGPGPRGSHLATVDKATAVVTDVGVTQEGLDAIAIAPAAADVSITKVDDSGGTAVALNDVVTYTATVTNNGPGIASVVQVTDVLSGAAVTSAAATTTTAGTCDDSAFPTITCDLGAMNPSDTATITIQVNATTAGAIVNDVDVTTGANDPDTSNNSAQVTTGVGSADVSVDKTENSTDPIAHPGVIDYTITVTNNATQAAGGVVVTDTVSGAATTFNAATPSQGTCDSTGFPVIVCNLGDIPVTGVATVNLLLNTSGPGTVTDTVNVTTATDDPIPANNTDTETTLVQAIDLAVTKTDSGPTAINFNITYTVTVTNLGNVDATGVLLTDTLSGAATTFVSATPSAGTCNTAGFPVITCDLGGTIAAGGSATVTIVVTPTAAGTVTNTAVVAAAAPPEGETANNTAAINTTVAAAEDFSLSASPASITLLQGQTGTTTITVTPLPFVATVTLSCTANIPLGGCSISPTTVNPGNLPATATLTVTTSGFFNAGLRKPLEQGAPLYAVWLPAAGLGLLGLVLVNENRRRRQGGKARLVLIGLTLLLLLTLVVGCGPLGRDRSDEGTPGGTYIVTVTGTGGGQTHTVDVPVTVQP